MAEFLFESSEFQVALDFALSADVTHPLAFRHVIRSALTLPEVAESVDADFQARLAELGKKPEPITEFAYSEMNAHPDSALARGNLAMAYHAFVSDPVILAKTALSTYDAAAKLGDEDAAVNAARLAAYDIGDLAEGERRMLEIFESGNFRSVLDLCNLYQKAGKESEYLRFLEIAESHSIPRTEDFRVKSLFSTNREGKLEVLRSLPGYFAPPKRGLSSEIVEGCRSFAMSEFADLDSTEPPKDFEGRFAKLIAARMLVLFPEEQGDENESETPPIDRFPMAAHYLDSVADFLSNDDVSPKYFDFLSNLSDLETPSQMILDSDGFDSEERPLALLVAEIQGLLQVMSGTPKHRTLVLKAAAVLRKVPNGDAFADDLMEAVSDKAGFSVRSH